MRKPDYTQFVKVLNKLKPDRPTLGEFFISERMCHKLENGEAPVKNDGYDNIRALMYAYKNAGFDFVPISASGFNFYAHERKKLETKSLNDGCLISDWETFEAYKWQEPKPFGVKTLDICAPDLPHGMKFVVFGVDGVLENTVKLTGYDNLCVMIYDEPELAKQIFYNVGNRLARYYEMAAAHDSVCAILADDDWGFKTQTMLSPQHMREFIFPWYKKVADSSHAYGKPVILHSCGNLAEVIDDIIDGIGIDAKHSFEDNIMPVEDVYEMYKGRLAIIGGIDMDFMAKAKPEAVRARCEAMLDRASGTGGYALGTGNSVPDYIPDENFYAMIDVVRHG